MIKKVDENDAPEYWDVVPFVSGGEFHKGVIIKSTIWEMDRMVNKIFIVGFV